MSGVVYFLQREDGVVKIGMTTDYPTRLKALEQMHGRLTLIAYLTPWGDLSLRAAERIAHAFLHFQNLREDGYGQTELFSPEVLDAGGWYALAYACPTIRILDSRYVVQRDLVDMAQRW